MTNSTQTAAGTPQKATSGRMLVKKRDGSLEPVSLDKIVDRVARAAEGLDVDPMRVATKAVGGLYNGATTIELDELCIQTAAALAAEDPDYEKLAARLLAVYIEEETCGQGVRSFSEATEVAYRLGLVSGRHRRFVFSHRGTLDAAVNPERNNLFRYFGLKTVYDRYLLKHPKTRKTLETPQFWLMRVACGAARTVEEALERYEAHSRLEYFPSTPTLFNSGGGNEEGEGPQNDPFSAPPEDLGSLAVAMAAPAVETHSRSQLASCFGIGNVVDSLKGILSAFWQIAFLSKFSGGNSLNVSSIRARGSLIRSTNGLSKGIVPWLQILNWIMAAVDQGGKRAGACAAYCEPWHPDFLDFLELRDGTGSPELRTYNLNTACWIPDLLFRRAMAGAKWSFFDPAVVPGLADVFGDEFVHLYEKAEKEGLAHSTMDASEVLSRMCRAVGQTGNFWFCFKDLVNAKANQVGKLKGYLVRHSNLCTEICLVTTEGETFVCVIGSVNLAAHVTGGRFDFDRLGKTVRTAVRQLDSVIDFTHYSTPEAKTSNQRWRPIGLGQMGLQDVFYELGLPFDSEEALALSTKISEHIYFHALQTSVELAVERGKCPFSDSLKTADGILQFDLWKGATPSPDLPWDGLREAIKKEGLRNSLTTAIAPTATIASIVGCGECTEPMVSNLFKRETLSGDFYQINGKLVETLKRFGLWNEDMRTLIKAGGGSIQHIERIPDEVRRLFRTAWEIPAKVLIDLAAARGPFIDQSQSLNLFMRTPMIGKISSMFVYAWQKGLKTTYYLRSRPATEIAGTTTKSQAVSDRQSMICSLENPEGCEACQ